MSDPLSITASVVSLITVAGQITTMLSGFINSISDAPDSARSALSSVEEMKIALISVKAVMDRLSRQPRHRKEMIHVKHLLVVCREAVLSVSELEGILKPSDGSTSTMMGMWDRVRWVMEEERIVRCLSKMEGHKNSLGLMLSILQSESDIEAQESLCALQTMVQKVLDQNQSLLRRLERYEVSYRDIGGDASVRFFDQDDDRNSYNLDDDASVRSFHQYDDRNYYDEDGEPDCEEWYGYTPYHDNEVEYGVGDDDDTSTIRSDGPSVDPFSRHFARLRDSYTPLDSAGMKALRDDTDTLPLSPREFELTLQRSRAYTRVATRDAEDVSFNSSAVRSHAWTELSLNDISVVSVIALPITLEEINRLGRNLTFARLIEGQPAGTTEWEWGDVWESVDVAYGINAFEERSEPPRASPVNPEARSGSPSRPGRSLLRKISNPSIRGASTSKAHRATPFRRYPLNPRVLDSERLTYRLVLMGGRAEDRYQLIEQLHPGRFNHQSFDPRRKLLLVGVNIDDTDRLLELYSMDADNADKQAELDHWIREGDGFLIFYDVTARESFEKVKSLHSKVLEEKAKPGAFTLVDPRDPLKPPICDRKPPVMIVGLIGCAQKSEVWPYGACKLADTLGCSYIDVETLVDETWKVHNAFFDVVRELERRWDESYSNMEC